MFSTLSVFDLSLAAFGLYLVKRILANNPPAPYPPGPKGLPLIGNVHQYPQQQEWKTFLRWANEFGDMVMVNLLGQRMVIVNSSKMAVDMFDKKSSIYSDRPTMVMGTELVGWGRAVALVPYGDRFRQLRRLLHGALAGKGNLAEYGPVEELETRRFLLRVLKTPTQLQQQIRNLAGSIILKVSHGYDVKEGEDPMVSLIEKVMDEFAQVTAPGAYLVDFMPFLQYLPDWLPGMGFKKAAVQMRGRLQDAMDVPHAFVKDQMAQGTAMSSYTSRHLETIDNDEQHEDLIKWGALAIYGGGADTTVSANYSFFLAMTLNPEIQKKAQEEIDRVVGTDRLPTLADRADLPYTEALVKEVFRWNPVAPQGVPHALKEDDIHEGYFIPKGTICIANIWKMLHDPCTYNDPMTFNPSRFIASGSKPAEHDPRSFCFGFGRRICPGLQLADSSVFLACAMALAAFNISKSVDARGNFIEPDTEYTSGIISHPKIFPCTIKPRSEKAEALIRSVAE